MNKAFIFFALAACIAGCGGGGGSNAASNTGSSAATVPVTTVTGFGPSTFVPPTIAPVTVNCVAAIAPGMTYDVGPGAGQLPKLESVDWNNLQPGDVVRVFGRTAPQGGPYAEKLLLSASGTLAQPIRLCGIPDANGAMPIITGQNATTRSDLQFETPSHLVNGYSNDLEPAGLIVISKGEFEQKPHDIIIEGLHLTGANEFTVFKAANGTFHAYTGFTACIYLHKGDNVVIRGNELSDCGHGVFALSKDYEPSTSRNLLIEGNYLHGNGAINSAEVERVHGMYIQVVGVTVQYNYFGPHRAGAGGGQYKDRSVGSVVRYNFFTPAARILDFVEQTDYDSSIDTRHWDEYMATYPGDLNMPTRASVVKAEGDNLKTYVYGNFIRNTFIEGHGAYAPIHWGGDQWITNKFGEVLGRHGKLYFFNNTIVSTANYRTDGFGATRLAIFDQGIGSSYTKASSIESYNNVIHLETTPNGFGQVPDGYLLRFDMGVVNMGKNWITTSWQQKGIDVVEAPAALGLAASGIINGMDNLITGINSPVDPVTLLATGAGVAALKGTGEVLSGDMTGLLDHEFQVNHLNPLLSIAVARNPATATHIGAAAIP